MPVDAGPVVVALAVDPPVLLGLRSKPQTRVSFHPPPLRFLPPILSQELEWKGHSRLVRPSRVILRVQQNPINHMQDSITQLHIRPEDVGGDVGPDDQEGQAGLRGRIAAVAAPGETASGGGGELGGAG